MSKWKEKIFDDVWKYLVGIVGGSSITGYLVSYLGEIPVWVWLFVASLFLLMILGFLYFYYPILIIRLKKRRTFSYWVALKKTLIDYQSNNANQNKKLEKNGLVA